jgi:hypothetical protein
MSNIVRLINDAGEEEKPDLQLEDFVAYMPMHNYIFKPTRDTWPASSVNARIYLGDKKKASEWLDKNAAVEQATWVPGKPMLIPGKIISEGGWIDAPDCTVGVARAQTAWAAEAHRRPYVRSHCFPDSQRRLTRQLFISTQRGF